MKVKQMLFFSLVFVVLLFRHVPAQHPEVILFDQGVTFYLEKNYTAAESNFLRLSSEFPDSPIASATLYMLMRSQYQLKKYEQAAATANLLLKRFPNSRYKDDIYYWLGNIHIKLLQYQKGVLYWLLAYKISDDSRLKKTLSGKINEALTNLFSVEELSLLEEKIEDQNLKILIRINIAREYIRQRKFNQAYQILQQISSTNPDHPYQNLVKTILNEIPFQNMLGGKTVLVSLPLDKASSTLSAVGNQFKQGLEFALEEHKEMFPSTSIRLEFIDDGGSSAVGIPAALDVISTSDVWVTIGSLSDDMTASLALLSRFHAIPHVSPVSFHPGLQKINRNTFILNPDPYTKGATLASYAREKFTPRTIVFIGPDDDYGHEFFKGFSAVWDSTDSVEFLDTAFFHPEAGQFMNQLSDIRYKAQVRMFRDSLDSVGLNLKDEEFLSAYRIWLTNKVNALRETLMKSRIDTLDIPIKNIDLFVAVIYPDQVQEFASQFAFFNFQTQLLGNEGWYNQEELDKVNSNYINNLIFISPLFIQEENWEYRNLRNKFRIKLKTTPEKYHLLGYNVGHWVFKALDLAQDKNQLTDLLKEAKELRLVGMNLYFSPEKGVPVNQHLNFIQYKYGKLFQIR